MDEDWPRSSGCLYHWLATGRTFCYKISAIITPHGMYSPSTPLSSLPSILRLRRTLWNGVKDEMRVEGKLANPGSPGRMAIKPACVYTHAH